MAKKVVIYTPKAPAPIGPYSQAVLVGDMLYVSGQIPLDPVSGELVNTSIEAETKKVMENLSAILSEAGFGFNDVVKCSIFVKDLGDFSAINSIYGSYFDEATAPARETVEVSALPKDVGVEISCVAVK